MKFSHIALLWIAVMIFGIAGINIYHHLELPKINAYRITERYIIGSHLPFIHKHYDVILEDTIYSQLWYDDIISMLQHTEKGDTVTFHLSGYGGEVQTEQFLVNNIKLAKAHVTMSVEAPVYSAHAYLALNGKTLVMQPYSFLMLHFSTVLNLDCTKQSGNDRGVSNIEHCDSLKKAVVYVNTEDLQNMPLLTDDERTRLYTGHDVYLQADEVERRQRDLNEKQISTVSNIGFFDTIFNSII